MFKINEYKETRNKMVVCLLRVMLSALIKQTPTTTSCLKQIYTQYTHKSKPLILPSTNNILIRNFYIMIIFHLEKGETTLLIKKKKQHASKS